MENYNFFVNIAFILRQCMFFLALVSEIQQEVQNSLSIYVSNFDNSAITIQTNVNE